MNFELCLIDMFEEGPPKGWEKRKAGDLDSRTRVENFEMQP